MISTRWRVALFLFFAAGLNYADRTALSSVIPPLRADLGITDAQVGLAGLIFLWTYAIASPFAGNIADRFSRSAIILWSLVAWSLVTVFTGLVQSVTLLLGMRLILGIAESFYLPAAAALLADHHGPASRGKAMGFHMLGLNLGLVLGGTSAGILAEHFGWRVGFWLLGGLGLVLAFTSKFMLVDGPQAAAPRRERASASAARQAWFYLLRVPTFYCLLVSAMVAGVASWIFLSWLPLFFAENYAMKLGAAGLAGVALYKAPVFGGIAIGGWLSDFAAKRTPRGRAMVKALSFIVSAPFLFLFLGKPTFTVVAAAMVISSLIRATGTPSEHPLICDVIPAQFRSTAVGIFNTCGSAAGGVGVLLAGIFKQDLGLNVIFGASSFLYILAGATLLVAYWFFIARDMQRAEAFEAQAGGQPVPAPRAHNPFPMESKPWHSLSNKTIWVTGGAGYLGSAITAELDAQCAKVLCFDLPGKAAAFAAERKLQRTVPIDLDVSDVPGAPAAIAKLVEQHGLPDGFVHLPTASSKGLFLSDLPVADFRRTFDVALTPTFVFCRELAERMKARGSGAFVLFASMYGMVAPDPRIYQAPMRPNPVDYGAAKAALISLTRYLATYYGPAGLRFNCVTPGPFPNPKVQAADPRFIGELGKKTALGRIGRNEEIAGPTLFLLTDSASYVTGHSLVVDGGWTAY